MVEQFLTHQIQDLLQSTSKAPSSTLTIWILALSTAFIDLIINLFMILLFAFYLFRTQSRTEFEDSALTSAQYLGKHFEQLMIENIRVMGSTLMWLLIFILPGFFRFVQLIYVPFVVLFDSDYQRGKKDALQTSKFIFYKSPLHTIGALFLLFIVWPLLSTLFFDEYLIFSEYPLQAFLIVCLESVLTLVGLFVLYKIYLKSRRSLYGFNF